jgi:hypothetical protein
MSRGPQSFKQGDVTRAIKATMKAGLPVARVELLLEGKRIIVIAGRPEEGQNSGTDPSEWD